MQSKITFTDSVVLPEGNVYVLTDENVARLYPFVTGQRGFVIEPGEDAKTLRSVGRIARDMLEKGCDRGTTFVTVGGGVVGDLGGFVAATYMRGLKWINVPTTLLAQVDSSVGGKTAVDLDGYKNIVGAFWLPEEVIVSPMWLDTLPPREKLCGEGEIFKTSLIDAGVYGMYEPGHITPELIRACIRFKEGVVRDDFRETGRKPYGARSGGGKDSRPHQGKPPYGKRSFDKERNAAGSGASRGTYGARKPYGKPASSQEHGSRDRFSNIHSPGGGRSPGRAAPYAHSRPVKKGKGSFRKREG